MKNQFTSRIVKITFAFMFVLIASSCSEDNEAMDAAVLAKETNEIAAKGAINIQSDPIVYFSYSGSNISGTDLIACLGDEITVTFNINQDVSCGKVRVDMLKPSNTQVLVEEELTDIWTVKVVDDVAPVNGVVTYTFTVEEEGTYKFRGSYAPESGRVKCGENITGFVYDDKLTVESCGCLYDGNGFTGTALSCGTSRVAEYTFSSEDGVSNFKMQGGLTNFTGTIATVYVNDVLVVFDSQVTQGSQVWKTGTVNGYTVGQRNPGGSSNYTIRVVGELGECSSVVVRIEWTSSNTGTTMTGGWSVKDGELELAPPVADLVCPN